MSRHVFFFIDHSEKGLGAVVALAGERMNENMAGELVLKTDMAVVMAQEGISAVVCLVAKITPHPVLRIAMLFHVVNGERCFGRFRFYPIIGFVVAKFAGGRLKFKVNCMNSYW